MPDVSCPFCGKEGFDLVGLKAHLTGEGLLFARVCQRFTGTLTIAEEQPLFKIKREQHKEEQDA